MGNNCGSCTACQKPGENEISFETKYDAKSNTNSNNPGKNLKKSEVFKRILSYCFNRISKMIWAIISQMSKV